MFKRYVREKKEMEIVGKGIGEIFKQDLFHFRSVTKC